MNTDKAIPVERNDSKVVPILPEQHLTGKILESAFAVHNSLGVGFLERVYSNALVLELSRNGITCVREKVFQVKYRDVIVGEYIADLVVESKVLVELKSCMNLDPGHEAQVINYLRASGIKVGLLFNFGRPKLQYRRLVC
jgi:GxxExxY protein